MSHHDVLLAKITWVRSLAQQYNGQARAHLLTVCDAAEMRGARTEGTYTTDQKKLREAIGYCGLHAIRASATEAEMLRRLIDDVESRLPREPEYEWRVTGHRDGNLLPNNWILPTLEAAERQAQYLMRHTYVRVEITQQVKP